jgi:hypothetical protein
VNLRAGVRTPDGPQPFLHFLGRMEQRHCLLECCLHLYRRWTGSSYGLRIVYWNFLSIGIGEGQGGRTLGGDGAWTLSIGIVCSFV